MTRGVLNGKLASIEVWKLVNESPVISNESTATAETQRDHHTCTRLHTTLSLTRDGECWGEKYSI